MARAEDVGLLPELERRASTIFQAEDLPPHIAMQTASLETYSLAQREARLIVASDSGSRVVGFACVIFLDGNAHLEEVDVDPEFGQGGIGRQLVESVCGWAAERAFSSLTLSTFRRVAWNAPFYAKLGFMELPEETWTVSLHALREAESLAGLDIESRVIMRRPIGPADLLFAPA